MLICETEEESYFKRHFKNNTPLSFSQLLAISCFVVVCEIRALKYWNYIWNLEFNFVGHIIGRLIIFFTSNIKSFLAYFTKKHQILQDHVEGNFIIFIHVLSYILFDGRNEAVNITFVCIISIICNKFTFIISLIICQILLWQTVWQT